LTEPHVFGIAWHLTVADVDGTIALFEQAIQKSVVLRFY